MEVFAEIKKIIGKLYSVKVMKQPNTILINNLTFITHLQMFYQKSNQFFKKKYYNEKVWLKNLNLFIK